MKKSLFRFGGILLVAFGVVWFLQGLGLVGGSFMTGQPRWVGIGAVTALIGLRLWFTSQRRS